MRRSHVLVAALAGLALAGCPTGPGGSPSVVLLLDGVALALAEGHDIGNTPVGTSVTVVFTIRNDGDAALELTAADLVQIVLGAGTVAGEFTLSTPPAASVAAGTESDFAITFEPASVGEKVIEVTITTNDPALPSVSFGLTGVGVPGSGWNLVGDAGFSDGEAEYVNLALDPSDGTLYTAYIDRTVANGTLHVKVFDGSTWSEHGDLAGAVSSQQYYELVFGIGDAPEVVYNFNNEGASWDSAIYVTSDWVAANNPQGDVGGLALAFSATGTAWLVFRDALEVPSGAASLYQNAEGWAWQDTAFTPAAASDLDIVIVGTNPFVSFTDDGIPRVYGWNVESMEPFGPSSGALSAGGAAWTSIAADSLGGIFVAFADETAGYRLTVVQQEAGATTTLGTAGFSAGAASYVQLAVDENDALYVAYRDAGSGDGVTVQRYNGSAWEVVGDAGFSAGAAAYVALVLDGTTPYVAYSDGANGGRVTVMSFE